MNVDRHTHIADVVAALPGAAAVLDMLGIDYSSPGERSIEEAAGLEGVDPNGVVLQLRRLPEEHRASWLDRSLSELLNHLTEQHERLTRDDLLRVAEQLADVCSGPAPDPALQRLRDEFKALSTHLLPHLRREQEMVFPLIRRIESMWQSKEAAAEENSLRESIKELLVEHGTIGARARTVRDLREALESHDVDPRCRGMLQSLGKLESDLRQSMFLENCILFPRALALHESLSGSPVTTAR